MLLLIFRGRMGGEREREVFVPWAVCSLKFPGVEVAGPWGLWKFALPWRPALRGSGLGHPQPPGRPLGCGLQTQWGGLIGSESSILRMEPVLSSALRPTPCRTRRGTGVNKAGGTERRSKQAQTPLETLHSLRQTWDAGLGTAATAHGHPPAPAACTAGPCDRRVTAHRPALTTGPAGHQAQP